MTVPPRAHPASASDAIADVLRGPRRPVQVLAAFAPAVYLAHDDGVLALSASDGIHHPNAVVDTAPTATAPFAGVRPHQRGWVGDGQLALPRRHLRVTRWFDPVPRLAPVDPSALRSAVARAQDHVSRTVGPTPDDLADPLGALVATLTRDGDDPEVCARQLLGRGPGLTPAGDDVLAGLLAAVVVLDRALPDRVPTTRLVSRVHRLGVGMTLAASGATTSISAALLTHATRGAVAPPAADLLHALAGRGSLSLPVALDRLFAVGSTSGRDLAVGLLAGAGLVLTPASRPAVTTAATDPRTP